MNKTNSAIQSIMSCNNPYPVAISLIIVTGVCFCFSQFIALAKERDVTVSYNDISVSVTMPKQINQQESESTTKQIPENINHPAQ